MITKAELSMKRDMDLIRKMLFAVEADERGFAPQIEIDGYTQEQIGYHAILLREAGLAIVREETALGASTPVGKILRLTWAGHEFLDAARDTKTWNMAKDSIVSKVGSATMQVWIAVLTSLIQKRMGI